MRALWQWGEEGVCAERGSGSCLLGVLGSEQGEEPI